MSAFYNASVAKWGEIAPKYRRPLPQSRIIGVKAVSNRRFTFKTAIPAIPYDRRMAPQNDETPEAADSQGKPQSL